MRVIQQAQRMHDAIMSILRQNDVVTSFWRVNDIIVVTCVHWLIDNRNPGNKFQIYSIKIHKEN